MNRSFLIVLLILAGTNILEAQARSDGAEEAARRAATAAVRGPKAVFLEALDVDGPLEERVGSSVWRSLTDRQKALLRSAARERFLAMLAPENPAASDVAWSAPLPSSAGGEGDVVIGLRFGEKTLKTLWRMRRADSGWRVRDVVLSDPGIALARAALETLGRRPLAVRRSGREILEEILPPFCALLIIALVVALAAPRLPAPRRRLVALAAAAAALVFLIAAMLVAVRGIRQPYLLVVPAAGEPWRRSEALALEAERAGRLEEAAGLRERAVAAGAPAGPLAYEGGRAARLKGDSDGARKLLESALASVPPPPGAAKELAALASTQGRLPEAERQILRYLADAGPDPEALSLLAVIETGLGKSAEAVAAIGQARQLAGPGSRGEELEAQVRARAGDAGGAVAVLRPLAKEGRIDRSVLRADPAYLPIATEPAWVGFINEK